MRAIDLCPVALVILGCAGDTEPLPPAAGNAAADAAAADAEVDASIVTDAGALAADAGTAVDVGGQVEDAGQIVRATVRIRATTQIFPHADNLAGQTPSLARAGVRSLHLLRNRNDPNPITLLSQGAAAVEVSYDDAADTVVAEVDHAVLTPGRYTVARMVQDWSRYRIEAAFHDRAGTHRGEDGLDYFDMRLEIPSSEGDDQKDP